MEDTTSRTADLKPLFYPDSLAVIGASREAGSVGQSVFANIIRNGYTGIAYPVNPRAKSILGVKCYPSILDVTDPLELAVIVTPSRTVPEVLRQCGQKGVKGAIVISAGFKEVRGEGVELERMVAKTATREGIRLLGPNCLGLINTDPRISLNASFASTMPREGNIAFLSQSGALCTAILDYAKGKNIGFSKFVSMGNKADVDENDLLIMLGQDPNTDVILMYLEELEEGHRFIRIARDITGELETSKPILAIKSGRTTEGIEAALSHTGALAGSDEAYDAVFAQSGVLRVESIEELFDYAVSFANQPLPRGRRVAIVTNAGGPGIMATDAVVRSGLELASFSKDTAEALRMGLPPAASVHNPVDLIGDAQHDRYEVALSAAYADENVDSIVVILTPQAMTDIEEIARVAVKYASRGEKPVFTCFMGIVDVSRGVKILEKNGVPHFAFPEASARSLAAMYEYWDWLSRPRTQVKSFSVDREKVKEIIARARRDKRRFLPEVEALEVLDAYGFPLPKYRLARTKDEATSVAEEIGYPVVLKVASPDIVHKVDVGGIRLGLESGNEVRQAFEEIVEAVSGARPDAEVWGVNVQEMVKGGKETIIGMKRDPKFGPLLMFGLGGIYVEAYGDVTFRLAPIRELSAYGMIGSIKASKILSGFRGEDPSDTDALAECLQRLSQLVTDFPEIQELDVNPLTVFEKGRGAKALDARIAIGI